MERVIPAIAAMPRASLSCELLLREAGAATRASGSSDAQALEAGEENPLFGMWRDRDDMADVEACVRKLRARRF